MNTCRDVVPLLGPVGPGPLGFLSTFASCSSSRVSSKSSSSRPFFLPIFTVMQRPDVPSTPGVDPRLVHRSTPTSTPLRSSTPLPPELAPPTPARSDTPLTASTGQSDLTFIFPDFDLSDRHVSRDSGREDAILLSRILSKPLNSNLERQLLERRVEEPSANSGNVMRVFWGRFWSHF